MLFRHRHKSGKSSTGSSPAPSHRFPPDNPIHTPLDGQSTGPFAIQLIPAFSTRPCAFNSCAMLRSPRYELRQPPSPLPPPPAFDDGGYEPVGEPGASSLRCDRPETRQEVKCFLFFLRTKISWLFLYYSAMGWTNSL